MGNSGPLLEHARLWAFGAYALRSVLFDALDLPALSA
jgi:hypothetical protein